MEFKQLYYCRECDSWHEINPEKSLRGCPKCGKSLEYVPVKYDDYSSCTQETRQKFQSDYLTEPETVVNVQHSYKKNEQRENENIKVGGCLRSIYTNFFSCLLLIILFFPGNALITWVGSNDNLQKTAEINLNTFIDDGKNFPTGEYVELEVRWVIGPYASRVKYNILHSGNVDTGLKAEGRKIDYYYVILEDYTIMSIATANNKEKKILNRISDWLLNAEGYPTDGETFVLKGKLRNFNKDEILDYYREGIESIFALDPDSSDVRMVVLDTGSGRFGGYIVAVEIVAAIILLIIVLRLIIKKFKERKKSKGRKKR